MYAEKLICARFTELWLIYKMSWKLKEHRSPIVGRRMVEKYVQGLLELLYSLCPC